MRSLRNVILLTISLALLATSLISTSALRAQEMNKVKYETIPTGDYRIDPAHSVIGFAIRHYEISWVRGRFKDFKGTIHYDDSDIRKSSVEFTANVESIDTGVEPRNAHLRTADFFDVAKYPEMTFKSTKIDRKSSNEFLVYGDLTLKGVTKPISFPFTLAGAIKDARGNTRFGVAAQTKINRRDYGITWGKTMESGGLDVGNEVTIDLQLEALKPAAKAAQQ